MTSRVHLVVGEPRLVRSALECAAADGRLLGVGRSAQLADGRVCVAAELVDPPVKARRSGPVRPWLIAAAVLGVLAAAAGLMWLLVLGALALAALITAAVGWVVGHLVWLGLGLLGLLLLARRGCPGVHCGGCRG